MAVVATDLLSIAAVNALDEAAFVATFGELFEATPSLAAPAHRSTPFTDRAALVAAFQAATATLSDGEVLALLQAHPMLGASGPMAAASVDEQASAGLHGLDHDLRRQIAADNARYLDRFGFPFIIAVRGLGVADIAAALASRLGNPADEERATALEQVRRIAALRLERLVAP